MNCDDVVDVTKSARTQIGQVPHSLYEVCVGKLAFRTSCLGIILITLPKLRQIVCTKVNSSSVFSLIIVADR